MSDHSITSLIEKLEGASEGSVELDALIYSHLNCTLIPRRADYRPRRRWPDGSVTLQRKVTTSLDAALALAERVGFLPYQADASIKGRWSWMVVTESRLGNLEANPYARATADTPALALCAAILRAQSEARV